MPEKEQSEKAVAVEPSLVTTAEEGKHAPTQPPQPQPFVLINVPKISAKQASAAKTFGLDVGAILDGLNRVNEFANAVVERLTLHEKVLGEFQKAVPQTVKTTMDEWAKQFQAKPAAATGAGQGGGGGGDAFMALLAKALEGGGQAAPNPFAQKAQDMALDALSADISLTKALKQFVLQKTAEKLTTEIVQKVA